MSVADHEAAQALIARYEALDPERLLIQGLYDQANVGEIQYEQPDELRYDLLIDESDIAAEAIELLRRLAFK